jgi:hypothetical protein
MTLAHEQLIDFILVGKTPEEVIGFTASDPVKDRVTDLISRAKDDGLDSAEKAELESYMQLEHLVRLAKARAHRILKGHV